MLGQCCLTSKLLEGRKPDPSHRSLQLQLCLKCINKACVDVHFRSYWIDGPADLQHPTQVQAGYSQAQRLMEGKNSSQHWDFDSEIHVWDRSLELWSEEDHLLASKSLRANNPIVTIDQESEKMNMEALQKDFFFFLHQDIKRYPCHVQFTQLLWMVQTSSPSPHFLTCPSPEGLLWTLGEELPRFSSVTCSGMFQSFTFCCSLQSNISQIVCLSSIPHRDAAQTLKVTSNHTESPTLTWNTHQILILFLLKQFQNILN